MPGLFPRRAGLSSRRTASALFMVKVLRMKDLESLAVDLIQLPPRTLPEDWIAVTGDDGVQMDMLVTPQRTIVFGLMGVQVVQDDVNLAAWVIDDDAVHGMQEFDAPALPVMAGFD